jgi:hypothetical protein
LRGESAEVPLSGWNAKRVIFGAMNLRTGARLFLPRAEDRSVDFQAFLDEIRRRYRGRHVALLLDGDSCHTATASLRAAEGMTSLWLPARAPELNPIDTLWGQGKDVVAANKQYQSIDAQVDRFLRFLTEMSDLEALHTSGVLSEDFWLRSVLSKNFCGPA